MNNVLFTDVNGTGEDVLAYTRLKPNILIEALKLTKKILFDDAYPIKDEEVQFYIHEPCWFSKAEERRAFEIYRQAQAN